MNSKRKIFLVTKFLRKWSVHLLLTLIAVLLLANLSIKAGLVKGLSSFEPKQASVSATPTPSPQATLTPTPSPTPTPVVIYIKPTIFVPAPTPTNIPTPTQAPIPNSAPPPQSSAVSVEAICKGYVDETIAALRAMVGSQSDWTGSYYEYAFANMYNYCLAHGGNMSGYQIPKPPSP